MPETLPPYAVLDFPPAPQERPYVFTNMVMTLDGKTVSGSREEAVMDLGSPEDHSAMRRIQAAADGVIIGARTLRGTKGLWFPEHLVRCVVTHSGDLNFESRFFADAPQKAVVAAPEETRVGASSGIRVFQNGATELNLCGLLFFLRNEMGVERLLCEGGSELNGSLFSLGVVDEMFLTLAPKVKLGRETPTYAGGEPLPKGQLQEFELIEEQRIGDELFLRYRRRR